MMIVVVISVVTPLVAFAICKTSRARSATRMIAHLHETEGDG